MNDFHRTGYGKRFFDHQLPDLISSIRDLTDQLNIHNQLRAQEIITNNAVQRPHVDVDFGSILHTVLGGTQGTGSSSLGSHDIDIDDDEDD